MSYKCLFIDGPQEGLLMEIPVLRPDYHFTSKPMISAGEVSATVLDTIQTKVVTYKIAAKPFEENGLYLYSCNGTLGALLNGTWVHRDKRYPARPHEVIWLNPKSINVNHLVEKVKHAMAVLESFIAENERIAGAKYFLSQILDSIPNKL